MAVCRASGPSNSIGKARGTALAEAAEEFHLTSDTDRVAVLVRYTLFGAALNGFAPV